ncbi:TetR family transcriptional regulator [Streptomyces albus]|uniref:TetR family transcriptional regulator n=1 Tax=Streptomyces albus (strain ATCC 21838 / DSM 41398 / FERM P-419 / JCM 4703 / NBRC 107858) TaxID=1081613 RepID=A0A0B5F4D3_STRA4|nr:TetR family transcriptional regulator [Streptomyces albus]AOU80069.1 TetR family transcriptional regulator [Streptomyces albus]AYN35787.1 TetR/AcrR family transcriptional regulator [Streptomyces albus]
MSRTKSFDPDAALRSALDLFWQRGYEATSMADLVDHLGIGRASIYATFGGKRELYLKALERYGELHEPQLLATLSRPGPALPAVHALVERFAAEATAEHSRGQGCFITNTAVELAPHDRGAARRVEASWAQLETLLHAALERARAGGELSEDADPGALARLLLVLLQGMRVVGKASGDPARVRDAAAQARRLLS